MDHNNLDVIGDFIKPLGDFLENFRIINLSELPVKNISDNSPTATSLSSSNTNQHFRDKSENRSSSPSSGDNDFNESIAQETSIAKPKRKI